MEFLEESLLMILMYTGYIEYIILINPIVTSKENCFTCQVS